MLNTDLTFTKRHVKKEVLLLKKNIKTLQVPCYMDPRDMAKLGVNNWILFS